MEGMQGVLVLSWHRTEVLPGHQSLISSQDHWILLGSKGAGQLCIHRHPKPASRYHITGEIVPSPVLWTHYLKFIYELLSWSRPAGTFCCRKFHTTHYRTETVHIRAAGREVISFPQRKVCTFENYPSMCWEELLDHSFYSELHKHHTTQYETDLSVPQCLSKLVSRGLSTHCPLASAEPAPGPSRPSPQSTSQGDFHWPHPKKHSEATVPVLLPAMTPAPRTSSHPRRPSWCWLNKYISSKTQRLSRIHHLFFYSQGLNVKGSGKSPFHQDVWGREELQSLWTPPQGKGNRRSSLPLLLKMFQNEIPTYLTPGSTSHSDITTPDFSSSLCTYTFIFLIKFRVIFCFTAFCKYCFFFF